MQRGCLALALVAGLLLLSPARAAETTLTVMSFNIYGGGANDGKPVDETVAAIRAAGADIVGIQETRLEGDPCTADVCPPAGDSVAKAIAEALGFHYYDQTQENAALWANAILSRYPDRHRHAQRSRRADRRRRAHGLCLQHPSRRFPYQPYQLLGIEYGDSPFLKTEAEAVHSPRRRAGRR